MPSKKAAVLHGELKNLVLKYAKEFALDGIYPIGSIYISLSNVNPGTKVGGTWELINDDTFIASKGITTAGDVGGSNNSIVVSHSHSISAHNKGTFQALRRGDASYNPTGVFTDLGQTHTVDASSGIGYVTISGRKVELNMNDHNIGSSGETGTNRNMPKYLACYIWKRVG